MALLSYLRQRLFCLLEVRYDRRWNIVVVFMALQIYEFYEISGLISSEKKLF